MTHDGKVLRLDLDRRCPRCGHEIPLDRQQAHEEGLDARWAVMSCPAQDLQQRERERQAEQFDILRCKF
jgi:hypothetical protein